MSWWWWWLGVAGTPLQEKHNPPYLARMWCRSAGYITTVAMSRSGQLGRRCTVEPNCNSLCVLVPGCDLNHIAPNVEGVLRHFHRYCYRSSPFVVILWGRSLASSSLAMDERSWYEDLRGSGSQSIIPYVYWRTELYYSSLPCLSHFFFSDLWICCLPDPFIAQGRTVTLKSKAWQVAPRWLKPYTTSRVLMARSS
jgi:hypothetical protein